MGDLNRKICDYIAKEWIGETQAKTEFALNHNIDEKTVRRIYNDKNYTITLYTLNKICEARNIKLSEFFKLIEEQSGSKINDDFVLKTNIKKDA